MNEKLLYEADPAYLEHLFQTERYVWLALSYDMVAVIDMEGCFRDVNAPWERATGYSVEDLLGAYLVEFIHFSDREPALATMQSLVTSDIGSKQFNFRFKCHNGTLKQMSWNMIYSPEHERYYCVAKDVTSRRAEDVMAIAYQDSLTGLHNRLYLDDHFPLMLERAKTESQPLSVHFLDLDGFKAINDSYGHKAGDVLLQKISQRIRRTFDCGKNLISRIGGDEFVMACACDGRKGCAAMLVEQVAKPVIVGGEAMRVSASVGVSRFPDHGATSDQLLEFADRAMYRVKKGSKNGFAVYEPDSA